MIKEGIHERLAEIYDEFDRHSQITNTKYSIDADYFNMQGYRIMDCNDFQGFLRHIANYVKNKEVDMEVNGSTLKYDDLFDPSFSLKQTEQPFFKFTISAIQETEALDEMQYRSPDKSYTAKVSPFRASMRGNKPGFQYENGGKKRKKKQKKDKVNSDSFERRLDSILAENMDLSFTEPEVLFTRDSGLTQEGDYSSYLKNARDSLSSCLDQYYFAVKNISDKKTIRSMNKAIENCTRQINGIDEILGGLNGTPPS